jgi:hypothetical protein
LKIAVRHPRTRCLWCSVLFSHWRELILDAELLNGQR